ncbi:hypothetical protein V1527DRAFT_481527 [Lipomyces starkeyi]
MAAAEPLPRILTRDSRLLMKRERERENATRGDFVFIDPDVRTFLTCYNLNENVVEVGSSAVEKVSKMLHTGGGYKGWWLFGTTKDGKTFKGHISGWVRESSPSRGHAQEGGDVSVCQLRQYIPPEAQLPHGPEAQQEVKGVPGHHWQLSFFDRAAVKAEQFEQTRVVEVNEERTSKPCSCCGWINQALGRYKDATTLDPNPGCKSRVDFEKLLWGQKDSQMLGLISQYCGVWQVFEFFLLGEQICPSTYVEPHVSSNCCRHGQYDCHGFSIHRNIYCSAHLHNCRLCPHNCAVDHYQSKGYCALGAEKVPVSSLLISGKSHASRNHEISHIRDVGEMLTAEEVGSGW